MKAVVYNGEAMPIVESRPIPEPLLPTDAIVKLSHTTICGSDLHILRGDVPTCKPGTVLGHEGVGVVERVGSNVMNFQPGDAVLISCISSCGTCEYCRQGMSSHCSSGGGWVLGNTLDGTQAEYVRVPNASSSLHGIPEGVDKKVMVLLSDIMPTGLECGVLNAKVQPGSSVVIVGAGPVGLAALIAARLYSPGVIIAVDVDQNRLESARKLGADFTAVPDEAEEVVNQATDGKGCDSVIEAVGIPQTFLKCQKLVAPGGVIANVGVHGTKVDLHLEELWHKNVAITTRLVDTTTTPMLLKLLRADKLPAKSLITHEFAFTDVLNAYSTFKAAAKNKALKVIINM